MSATCPFDTFTKAYCKGSILLGSACGHCERCEWERKHFAEQSALKGLYTLQIELPGLPPMMNASGKSRHFRTTSRERRLWRRSAAFEAYSRRPQLPLAKAKITCTRFSSVEPDFDGLVSGFKPLIDGLKDAGVLKDDKRVNIGQPDYQWVHVGPGDGKVTIRVEAIE